MRELLGTPVRLLVAATVLGLGLFAAVIVVPMLGMFASLPSGALDGTGAATMRQECLPSAETAGRRVTLGTAQLSNAATIIRVGRTMAVPERGLVVAVATAMQESTLDNLDHGDRDSVGLFQQRPSSGWGTVAELTDPPTSAAKFYRALLKVPGWGAMPLTTAAQTVQRSAFPFAYAKWESLAVALVRGSSSALTVTTAATGCGDVVTASLPAGEIGTMLGVALAQVGDPYVWGATGPDAFDCSGLVVYAWRQAGFRLSVRTAAQMAAISTPVANGSEQPGDLYFGEFGVRGQGAGHVMIVVRPGVAVQAPETGRDVETTTYDVADHPGWHLGRLPASSLETFAAPAATG